MTVRRNDFAACVTPRSWVPAPLARLLTTHVAQKYLIPIGWFRALFTVPGPRIECQIIGCSRVAVCQFVNGVVEVYVCIWHKHRLMEGLAG